MFIVTIENKTRTVAQYITLSKPTSKPNFWQTNTLKN